MARTCGEDGQGTSECTALQIEFRRSLTEEEIKAVVEQDMTARGL